VDAQTTAPVGLQFSGHGAYFVLPVYRQHVGAGFGQASYNGLTDALGGPRDDGGFAS
jgi:hypothetical protein